MWLFIQFILRFIDFDNISCNMHKRMITDTKVNNLIILCAFNKIRSIVDEEV